MYKISNLSDFAAISKKIGVTSSGSKIMKNKSQMQFFYIKNIKTPAANILKQEALAVGCDLAVPKDCILYSTKTVNALLFGTNSQISILSKKLKSQPFGLKTLSNDLKSFINLKQDKKIKIMGVVNATTDSFYKESRFQGKNAITKINQMINEGASIIDLGAISSRPGSIFVSPQIELERLKPIIDEIYKNKIYEKAIFSLDSFEPLCIEYALDRGFTLVNDITGLANIEVAKIVAKYNASICIMHMQNNPENMQNNPFYPDVLKEVDEFFAKKIAIAKENGVKNIILDVGIGFGKTLEHNLLLIKHHENFLHFGCELLVGASRKSLIDKITPSKIEERLPGTLTLHLAAIKNAASIIRVHDVKEHYQALKVYEAIENINLQG